MSGNKDSGPARLEEQEASVVGHELELWHPLGARERANQRGGDREWGARVKWVKWVGGVEARCLILLPQSNT